MSTQVSQSLRSQDSTVSMQASTLNTIVADPQHDNNKSSSTVDLEKNAVAEAASASSETVVAAKDEAPAVDPTQDFPDGGLKAWLCVVGAFCCLFVSFGWINCIGVFQDYYQSTLLSNYPSSTVAWIPSLETFVMFFAGPFLGRLYDNYGPRWLLLGGTFLHVFGLMMTSLSTQYYQFILAQGVCSPLGASAVFFSAISSASTWFLHRRAFALGIVAAGSSLGGVIFPILVQNLIPKIGFPWTMRVSAFLILGLLAIANLTVRSRLPPNPKPFSLSGMVKPFIHERPLMLMTAASFLVFLGLFVPFDFLILQAPTVGVSALLAQYLIPILNASSILGRTLPGYLGDKLGRFNVLTVFCYMAGILCLALWLPGYGEGAVVTFAVLYGFASGAFVSMVPACLAQISPIREIGMRNGTLFAVISIAALIGNPIAGSLVTQDHGSYHHLEIFAGALLVAGSTGILLARLALSKSPVAKV